MSKVQVWHNNLEMYVAVLHFATLFTVSFKLGAETHFFATLVTFISTLILCAVDSHVRASVTFVLIFVNTSVFSNVITSTLCSNVSRSLLE